MPTLALDLPIDLLAAACFVHLSSGSNLRLLSTLSLVCTSWHEATLRAFRVADALRWRAQNRSVSTIMHHGAADDSLGRAGGSATYSKIGELVLQRARPDSWQVLREVFELCDSGSLEPCRTEQMQCWPYVGIAGSCCGGVWA